MDNCKGYIEIIIIPLSVWLQLFLEINMSSQMRVINIQAAAHVSWLVRCSPRAPAFSRINSPEKSFFPSCFEIRREGFFWMQQRI